MILKKLAFLVLFLLSFTLNAQDVQKQKNPIQIGFTFSSFGENDIFQGGDLIGGPGYTDDNFYTIGLTVVKPLNSWLDFESGLEYSNQSITVHPNLPPDVDAIPYNTKFSFLNIPLTIRANFLNYFFANGGLIIDIDTKTSSSIDSQSGIGAMLGIGAKYDFKCGASFFINPYLKFHSLLAFSPENHHQKVYESGIRLGFVFSLSKK